MYKLYYCTTFGFIKHSLFQQILDRIMKNHLLTYLLLFTFQTGFCNDYLFNKLGVNEGLSQVSALDIHQDHLNRIWIGTRDGLNCYDGNKIKVYRSVKGDPSTLISSEILKIAQMDNHLWLLSATGVSSMNLDNMLCKRYPLPLTQDICVFDNTIVVSTNAGVLQFNATKDSFEPIENLQQEGADYKALYNNRDEELWVGTTEMGLLIYNKNTKEVGSYHENKIKDIAVIKRDNRYNIWIGSETSGLYLLTSNLEISDHFTTNRSSNSIINNAIRDIAIDQHGNVWIGTFRGISIYHPKTKTFQTLQNSKLNPTSLSHNSVYSFLIDRNDDIWIGTYFGGVNYTKTNNQLFTYYNNHLPNKHPSYHVIGPLVEDEINNIWIGTEGGGLNYYDRATGNFTYYQANGEKNALNQNNVKALHLHNRNTLLIGTYMGGLNVLDIPSGTIKNYLSQNDDAPSIIGDIKPYKGEYLISARSGLFLFNLATERFTPFLKREQRNKLGTNLFGIHVDSKENIWIASVKNGLFKYTPELDELKHYTSHEFDSTSLGSNNVLNIYEDHKFRIWIATIGGGLSLYLPETDNFRTYTQLKDNLPSNHIYGITESRFGCLWISTLKGLSRFDVENNKFYNYDHTSGFPLSELNQHALLLSSKGELYVGGIDGMVSFNEAKMINPQPPTDIIISTLSVNNQEVRPYDHHNILTNDISATEQLTLGPKQNAFRLDFASLNYDPEMKHQYEYMLEGFDEKWIRITGKSYASYTNISPGKYKFKVRALDAINHDILGSKSIDLILKPSFYNTWYAYLIYTAIFLSMIILFNYARISKVRLSYKLSQEQKERVYQDELNQNKLRFFTNISHEFQTPLTLILGSLELLKKSGQLPGKAKKRIELAYLNVSRLKNLTSELLDFRKVDQGYLKLKLQELNFIDYIEAIYNVFYEIAGSRKIKYSVLKEESNITIWCDPVQMDKVFYNLLSNAFKFTEDNTGEITIEIVNNAQDLEIYIKDNGKGIPENECDQVFNRFFQTENHQESNYVGYGIGLALSKSIVELHGGTIQVKSEIARGTTLIIRLQKGNKHFDPKHIFVQTANSDLAVVEKTRNIDPESEEAIEAIEPPDMAPTILVVDDNPDIIKLVKEVFEESYFILEAENGEEGFKIALEKQPDLIISDVLMPVLSDTEMCKKLKQNFLTSHIPVILLTARAAMEHKIMGIETGADDYITKPFNIDYLAARVDNIFNNLLILQQKYSQDISAKTRHITKNKMDQEFLDKAIKIIEENITDPDFSVTEFTAEMGQSRTLFYKKLKGVTGKTPNDLIQTIRLKNAAKILLTDPTKNVSEIAYDVGFSSPRYFSQCFRNHFGVIPSKYILENEEGKEEDN